MNGFCMRVDRRCVFASKHWGACQFNFVPIKLYAMKKTRYSNTQYTSIFSFVWMAWVRGNVQFYRASIGIQSEINIFVVSIDYTKSVSWFLYDRNENKLYSAHTALTHIHIIYPLATTVGSFQCANQLKRKISKEISRSRPFEQQKKLWHKKKKRNS